MLTCVSVPTLLTQNQSSALLPLKKNLKKLFFSGNTGRAAVYETSDVFLCDFFVVFFLFFSNRLNINLL